MRHTVTTSFTCDYCGKRVNSKVLPKDWKTLTNARESWARTSDCCSEECFVDHHLAAEKINYEDMWERGKIS